MAKRKDRTKKKSVHEVVEEMLHNLDNDAIEQMAPLGLDQPFDGHPTLVQFEIDEDGNVSLDLDLKVTALIPLEALLHLKGRASEKEAIIRSIKLEEEEKERAHRLRVGV